jgi:hypothetical protein
MLVGLLLCLIHLSDAKGQVAHATAGEFGVRHSLIVAIELDRDAGSAKPKVGEIKADMRISVRVLDYAPDSRFYGIVVGNFSDFDPSKGAAAQEIWADQKCHHNRGLPRIWVLAINGRVSQGETMSEISARPRTLGLRLPPDEIVLEKVLKTNVSDPAQSLVMRATTKRSPLGFRLTLTSTMCRLN